MSQNIIKTTGYVREFFFGGDLVSSIFQSFPQRSQEESRLVAEMSDAVTKYLRKWEDKFQNFDELATMDSQYIDGLKELGLFGLIIPEQYGGLGLGAWGYSKVIETVSYFDASTAVMLGAHSSIGLRGIVLYGNEDQKSRYLPKLATGEKVACFCLTEPNAGSDAASIRTKAEKNGDYWTLNGQKIWITNSPFADVFTVFARTESPAGSISAFIVERDTPGLSVGSPESKLGIRSSKTATVYFENVRVPTTNLLGEEGKGFKIAMTILNNGRTGLAGGALGGMRRMLELAEAHANNRQQFGKRLIEFDLIKEKLARIKAKMFALDAMVNVVSHMIDSKHPDCALEAAILKVFATESLWEACDEALQIAGGNGYMKEYPYERFLRDARINRIFEGSNEILRLFISLNGFKALAESFKDLQSASSFYQDPIKGFGLLATYVFGPKVRPSVQVSDALVDYLRELAKVQKMLFKVFCKLARREGGNIVGKQMISLRVADSVIWLFALSCALAKLQRCMDNQSIAVFEYLLNLGLSSIQASVKSLERNETELVRKLF